MKIECDNLKKEWRQFQQEKKSFLRLEYFTHLLLIKLISQLCCNEQRDDMLSYVYELGHCGLFFLVFVVYQLYSFDSISQIAED